jgi:hypothetical protein
MKDTMRILGIFSLALMAASGAAKAQDEAPDIMAPV